VGSLQEWAEAALPGPPTGRAVYPCRRITGWSRSTGTFGGRWPPDSV